MRRAGAAPGRERTPVVRLAVELRVRGRRRGGAVEPCVAQVGRRGGADAAIREHDELGRRLHEVGDAVLPDRQPPLPPEPADHRPAPPGRPALLPEHRPGGLAERARGQAARRPAEARRRPARLHGARRRRPLRLGDAGLRRPVLRGAGWPPRGCARRSRSLPRSRPRTRWRARRARSSTCARATPSHLERALERIRDPRGARRTQTQIVLSTLFERPFDDGHG